jgi:hypothetical protein
VEIAAAVIAFLSTDVGKSLANKAGGGVAALYAAIRRKFDDDGDAVGQQALGELEQEPQSVPVQRIAVAALARKVEADEAFAAELRDLLREADTTGEFRFAYDVGYLDAESAEIQNVDIPDSVRVLVDASMKGQVIRGKNVRAQNVTVRRAPPSGTRGNEPG